MSDYFYSLHMLVDIYGKVYDEVILNALCNEENQ